jgi:hypothetical protein
MWCRGNIRVCQSLDTSSILVIRSRGPVAQLGERLSYTEDVAGISFGDASRTSPAGITKNTGVSPNGIGYRSSKSICVGSSPTTPARYGSVA